MKAAFVLYPGFTALDVIGPHEVIAGWPDTETVFVATSDAPVRSDRGLVVAPTCSFADLGDVDLLLVGGASDPLTPLRDEPLLDGIRAAAASATWLTSVCTGAGIYAAAGLVAGRRAATHWAFRDALAAMGVEVETERVVRDGAFVSAAGVSAGIDMALELTAVVHGVGVAQQVQLAIEYDPAPPFDTGSPEKAGPELVDATLRQLAGA